MRAGYYFDESPQPLADVGPILADADRNAYTAGIRISTPSAGASTSPTSTSTSIDRDTRGEANNDQFFGVYSEAANLIALSFRLSF